MADAPEPVPEHLLDLDDVALQPFLPDQRTEQHVHSAQSTPRRPDTSARQAPDSIARAKAAREYGQEVSVLRTAGELDHVVSVFETFDLNNALQWPARPPCVSQTAHPWRLAHALVAAISSDAEARRTSTARFRLQEQKLPEIDTVLSTFFRRKDTPRDEWCALSPSPNTGHLREIVTSLPLVAGTDRQWAADVRTVLKKAMEDDQSAMCLVEASATPQSVESMTPAALLASVHQSLARARQHVRASSAGTGSNVLFLHHAAGVRRPGVLVNMLLARRALQARISERKLIEEARQRSGQAGWQL